jgi:hypothetical protein
MAKLQTPNTAGFNAAGNGYNVKLVKIDDIVIDPEIAGLFAISDKNKDEIVEKMKKYGFYKEEPVTLWGKILVDGRTRYTAAKEAGLKEIPAVERNFESREDAILYTFDRQVVRRNLTGAEILKAARSLLNKKKAANGTGRSAEMLAKRLGIHVSTLYQAEAIAREAPGEIIKAVENGDMSLKKGYKNRNPNSAPATNKPKKEKKTLAIKSIAIRAINRVGIDHNIDLQTKEGLSTIKELLHNAVDECYNELLLVVRDD